MGKRHAARRARSEWEKRTIRTLARAGSIGDLTDPRLIFLLAVGEGQLSEARKLVDDGWVGVNDLNPLREADSNTLLQCVAGTGNLDIVKFMVERGADPNRVGPEGTALHWAARQGHERVYAYLRPITDSVHHTLAGRYLQDGERRPREEREKVCRLSQACRMGQMPTVVRLLRLGIGVNASTIGLHGSTALHAACGGGHRKIVDALLEAGADPNAESYDGVTPLAFVAAVDVCRAMLKAGAEVNHRDHVGCTPLMRAVNFDVFSCMVKAGGDMMAVDNVGRCVLLHLATTAKRRTIFDWPKALKADSKLDKGLAAAFRQLTRAGVSVNHRHPADGVTALMLTASLDLREAVAVLLKAGADVGARDKDGKMARDYAKTRSPLRKELATDHQN